MVDQCKYMIAFEFPEVKRLTSFSSDDGDDPSSAPIPAIQRRLPFELSRNIGKTSKSSVPVLSAGKPWFFLGFFAYWANCFGFPAYPCMSMPAGAAPVEIVVLCAALDPGESSRESPESSKHPRFSRENMLFCSGGAGFELGEFES
jgi:hypothetical protein